jgi:hypothetical protein
MARKRHSDEDILKLLREIELALASGHDVATACRSVGVVTLIAISLISAIELQAKWLKSHA